MSSRVSLYSIQVQNCLDSRWTTTTTKTKETKFQPVFWAFGKFEFGDQEFLNEQKKIKKNTKNQIKRVSERLSTTTTTK